VQERYEQAARVPVLRHQRHARHVVRHQSRPSVSVCVALWCVRVDGYQNRLMSLFVEGLTSIEPGLYERTIRGRRYHAEL